MTFLPFRAFYCSFFWLFPFSEFFFFVPFSSLTLPTSAASSVHIVGSLTSKLCLVMSIWEVKKRLINRANQRPPEIIMPPGNEICQRQSSFLGVFDVWGKFLEMWSVQTEIWDEERTNKEVMWWATWFENIFVCLPTQLLFWAIRLCLPFFVQPLVQSFQFLPRSTFKLKKEIWMKKGRNNHHQ